MKIMWFLMFYILYYDIDSLSQTMKNQNCNKVLWVNILLILRLWFCKLNNGNKVKFLFERDSFLYFLCYFIIKKCLHNTSFQSLFRIRFVKRKRKIKTNIINFSNLKSQNPFQPEASKLKVEIRTVFLIFFHIFLV